MTLAKLAHSRGDVDKCLDRYRELLLSTNKKQNLVSRRDVDKLLPALIAESLLPLSWDMCRLASPLLDVGSGGGLPGIPLKIHRSDLALTLLDSNRKKSSFLRFVIEKLDLQNAEAIWERLEIYASDPVQKARFGTITARGFGSFDLLLEAAAKLLKPGGELILWKNEDFIAEASLSVKYFDAPNIFSQVKHLALIRYQRNDTPAYIT